MVVSCGRERGSGGREGGREGWRTCRRTRESSIMTFFARNEAPIVEAEAGSKVLFT